ncbi:MAG: diguanylate cyclase, partial [Gammaproteobacteria bacterium]|nr:diguanylate cyclase [Gammaproteobacteria bacterium]
EFVLLIQALGNDAGLARDRAGSVAHKLRESVSEPLEVGPSRFELRCSIGVSMVGIAPERPVMVLRSADTAMYRAKRLGRNRVVFAEDLGACWHLLAEVGCEAIDADHRRIEALLRDAMSADDVGFPRVMRSVIAETRAHFLREERHAEQEGLAMTGAHVADHTRLDALMERLLDDIEAGRVDAVWAGMTEALREHVLQHDVGLIARASA